MFIREYVVHEDETEHLTVGIFQSRTPPGRDKPWKRIFHWLHIVV